MASKFTPFNKKDYQKGSAALFIALQKYINENLIASEQEFCRDVLPYAHNFYKLVENLPALVEKYNDHVLMHSYETWRKVSGVDYLKTSGIEKHLCDKNGKVKKSVVQDILNNETETKGSNKYPFIMHDKLNEIMAAPKEIIATKLISFGSNRYGKPGEQTIGVGTIYRRMVTFELNGEQHLALVDTRMYQNSPKIISEFKLLVNGKVEGIYTPIRLDSCGFMETDYLNKHNINHTLAKDIESLVQKDFTHENYFNEANAEQEEAIGKHVDPDHHIHISDAQFEKAKAFLNYYITLLPEDAFAREVLKEARTKHNARTMDVYSEQNFEAQVTDAAQQKLQDAKKYSGVIPMERYVDALDNTLNIQPSAVHDLAPNVYHHINLGRNPEVVDYFMNAQSIENEVKQAGSQSPSYNS